MAYYFTLVFYLLFLFVFGLRLTRRLKKKEDFLVAGRSLTAPILVGTLLATWIGSGDIFSVSDLSYNHGYSSLIGSSGGWLGIIVAYFIAGRVRRFGQFTVPDILEARYNHWARILATITTIIAYVTIVSYQFRGGGWVLNIISDGQISIRQGIIIVAVFVIIYTLLAGMISVAYLDIFNGLIMITGIFLALPFLIKTGGGLAQIAANVTPRAHPFLGNMTWVQALGYFVPTLLLALGNGNMYQRFFSAKNEKEAQRAVLGWILGAILLGVALQSLAVIGSSIFKGLGPREAGKIILLVAHRGVPVAVGCLLLAAIVAIVISTANSFLLVPATNVIRDIYQRFINPNLSDKKTILYSRAVVILLGIIAYSLISFFPRILDAAYAAYTVYGAGLTPALMAVFFWRRATAAGGVASILGGMLITVVWEILNKVQGGFPLGLPSIYPALVGSIILLVGVSLITPRPEPAKWQPFTR
ncbi:sodium:solute symporter family protein [Candidatus Aminicenantes bacterium AC-334-K16]|jgi:SSS family solute:Na+ symporter/sodium/proline symporter|nr:sodium:solute symporter family protein [Candidatus Aminicenantes bacterium AC-334-K16]